MIDYKQLKARFSEKLSEFDQEDLLKWVDFDQNRELVSRLINGESVPFQYKTATPYKLTDKRETINSEVGDQTYAMAA